MSDGGAHLGGEEETVKGGIFSTGRCLYRWRRERRFGLAPWVGDGCRCRARVGDRQHALVPLLRVADMWARGWYLKVVQASLA
jgi:hypothetical protein